MSQSSSPCCEGILGSLMTKSIVPTCNPSRRYLYLQRATTVCNHRSQLLSISGSIANLFLYTHEHGHLEVLEKHISEREFRITGDCRLWKNICHSVVIHSYNLDKKNL